VKMPKAKDNREGKKNKLCIVYLVEITKHLRAMMTTTITIIIVALSAGAIAVETVFSEYIYIRFL